MISSDCDRLARSNRRAHGNARPTETGPACAPDSSATCNVSRTVRSANRPRVLERPTEPEHGTPRGTRRRHVAPFEDHTAVTGQESSDRVHQGGLARAVRPDEAHGLLRRARRGRRGRRRHACRTSRSCPGLRARPRCRPPRHATRRQSLAGGDRDAWLLLGGRQLPPSHPNSASRAVYRIWTRPAGK